jgi:hypothetical protein
MALFRAGAILHPSEENGSGRNDDLSGVAFSPDIANPVVLPRKWKSDVYERKLRERSNAAQKNKDKIFMFLREINSFRDPLRSNYGKLAANSPCFASLMKSRHGQDPPGARDRPS